MIGLGIINTFNLSITGEELALNSEPSELIGIENTTIVYIIFIFLANKHLFCMFVLTPIYLAVNIAMLVMVYDDIEVKEGGKDKHQKAVGVVWRFASIGCCVLFAQYLVFLQQTELFLQNRIVKLQQKQLVNVFNNQPDGIVLTRADDTDKTQQPDGTGSTPFKFELCNQAVAKILGFMPTMEAQFPGSILKHTGMKMLSKPMFLELGTDENERTVTVPDIAAKQVRFKDSETDNHQNE